MLEHLGNRVPELHRHVSDLHATDDHSRLIHHRAAERVFSRRSRLGRDRHRVPTDEVVQPMNQQHAVMGDWQATVDRAFGDGGDWIR